MDIEKNIEKSLKQQKPPVIILSTIVKNRRLPNGAMIVPFIGKRNPFTTKKKK